jgi:NADH-ubiquinone oxidoreductase chain 4
MLFLIFTPLLGLLTIYSGIFRNSYSIKFLGIFTTIINFLLSLIIFLLFDFSDNQFQFIQENYSLNGYNVYLGIDGLSIYFILLTTIIMPICIVSN